MLGALRTAASQPCPVLSPCPWAVCSATQTCSYAVMQLLPDNPTLLKESKGVYTACWRRGITADGFQQAADTMFYLGMFVPGTVPVPCVKRGRRHRHKAAFLNPDLIQCKTDLSSVKALQHGYLWLFRVFSKWSFVGKKSKKNTKSIMIRQKWNKNHIQINTR